MVKFIGDVHAKFQDYHELIKEHKDTIQVGDMGVGFKRHDGWPTKNPSLELMVQQNARFIRGNHDNPEVCRKHSQWIPDGRVEDDMMFIGGAFSIDKDWRTPGYDWWPDEELRMGQFEELVDIYMAAEPACMVTHDCPASVIKVLHSHHLFDNSITQQALEFMLKYHRPKVWVFGHHHMSFDQVIDGTRFVCLDELEVKDINWRIIA